MCKFWLKGWSHLCLCHCRTVPGSYGRRQVTTVQSLKKTFNLKSSSQTGNQLKNKCFNISIKNIAKGISSPTPRVARIRSRVWAGLTPGKRVGTRIYNSTRRLLDGGFSGLLDFVLQALRALRPCDPYNAALDSEKSNKYFWFFSSEYFSWSFWNQRSGVEELWILVVGRTKTVNA